MNHWGKMMFRWMYWNMLLKGQELPLPARMTMAGKWKKLRRRSWTRQSLELNQKIDALTAQVGYLAEQARIAERQRQERAELMRDLTPIANEAFRLAIEQLEEVQEYVDLADLLRLLKRLVRNAPQHRKMLDQLESVMDLARHRSARSPTRPSSKAVDVLAELEHKGYFAFAQGGLHIVDNIVTSFTEEDVERLGDNIVLILQHGQGDDPAGNHELRAQHVAGGRSGD